MRRILLAAMALATTTSCNPERKQQCDRFSEALRALDAPKPSAEDIGRARDALAAVSFQDEPLREYAKNTTATLTVLANTLELQGSPSAPDGTDDVIKQKFKEARTDRDDVARYCAQ